MVGRLYAPVGVCDHVRTVAGRCPQHAGEVMVSHEDATVNGWRLGGTIPATQVQDPTFPGDVLPGETLKVVGIYEPVARRLAGGAPDRPGRPGDRRR